MANKEVQALALSAQGASVNGPDQENTSGRTAIMVVDLTANSGGSSTFTLEGKDSSSGKYYTIISSIAMTAVATIVHRIDPSLTASANSIVADVVPRIFRVTYTRGTTAITTATVGVLLVG